MERARKYQLTIDGEPQDRDHFTDYINPYDHIGSSVGHHGVFYAVPRATEKSDPDDLPCINDDLSNWITSGNDRLGKALAAYRRSLSTQNTIRLLKLFAERKKSSDWPLLVGAGHAFLPSDYGTNEPAMITWGSEPKQPESKVISLTAVEAPDTFEIVDEIDAAIHEAGYITELKEDWDQQGAKAISKELFEEAATFLRTYAKYLDAIGRRLTTPEINPFATGSIDLSWRTEDARLLININSVNGTTYANFYGDKFNDKAQFKGKTETTEFFEPLASWMKFISK